jgi:hypothetical protein
VAITFDPAQKLAILSAGTTSLSVVGFYSRWKDWVQQGDNAKFLPAFSVTGGDPVDVAAGTSVPCYAFLKNGWRVRPQEASHTLSVVGGVLLVDGGGDPFVGTLGAFVVRVNYSQPVQAITVATGGSSGPTVSDIWGHVIDAGLSAEVLQRLMAAVLLGKVSGAEAGAPVFRDLADTKARVTATTDVNGNRTSVTLNGA